MCFSLYIMWSWSRSIFVLTPYKIMLCCMIYHTPINFYMPLYWFKSESLVMVITVKMIAHGSLEITSTDKSKFHYFSQNFNRHVIIYSTSRNWLWQIISNLRFKRLRAQHSNSEIVYQHQWLNIGTKKKDFGGPVSNGVNAPIEIHFEDFRFYRG